MNVYDFDKTIYDGDSTLDFYQYCLFQYPRIAVCLPKQIWSGLQYMVGKTGTTEFKEHFFSFLTRLSSLDMILERFWELRKKRIKVWYLAQREYSDVIVSASPAFLLIPICKRLGVMPPIATELDPITGRIDGENCKGEEKVHRFLEKYPGERIQRFYSDSRTDAPLAALAEEAFLVHGDVRLPWGAPP